MQSDILDRLSAIPGVTAAAFASALPMESEYRNGVPRRRGRKASKSTSSRLTGRQENFPRAPCGPGPAIDGRA